MRQASVKSTVLWRLKIHESRIEEDDLIIGSQHSSSFVLDTKEATQQSGLMSTINKIKNTRIKHHARLKANARSKPDT